MGMYPGDQRRYQFSCLVYRLRSYSDDIHKSFDAKIFFFTTIAYSSLSDMNVYGNGGDNKIFPCFIKQKTTSADFSNTSAIVLHITITIIISIIAVL